MLMEVLAWQQMSPDFHHDDSVTTPISRETGDGDFTTTTKPGSSGKHCQRRTSAAGRKQPTAARSTARGTTQELALPYAVALAAALSVESPFVHIEHAVSLNIVSV
jgi:hypothetical protein